MIHIILYYILFIHLFKQKEIDLQKIYYDLLERHLKDISVTNSKQFLNII